MTREQIFMLATLPIYSAAIGWEAYRGHKLLMANYSWRDTALSIWFGVAAAGMDMLMKGVAFGVLNWCNRHAFTQPDMLVHHPILAWGLVFVLQDFWFYWLHRTEHQVRLFWASHSTHHSSHHYNFAVALRSSVFQPVYRFIFYVPIAFFGFDGLTIMFMYAVNQFYQFWLHTETIGKLPAWYEYVFVTPSHHRVHHASNARYLDRNMGQVLIIWDRLFGTFQKEEKEKPVYGLTKPLDTYHPIGAITNEYQKLLKDISQAENPKLKWQYLWKPPGWKPESE